MSDQTISDLNLRGVNQAKSEPTTRDRAAFGSLRMIIFASFVGISVLPLLVLTIWLQKTALEKEFLAVEEKHLIVARNLSMALSRYVIDVKTIVDLYAEATNQGLGHAISDKAVHQLDLRYIATLGPDGNVENMVGASPSEIALPASNLLAELKEMSVEEDDVVISDIIKLDGEPHFLVAKTLPDNRLVLAPLSPKYVRSVQKSIAFGDRGHSMIVDRRGRVVAHPKADWQQESKDVSKISVVQKMMARQTGVAQFYAPPIKADAIAGFTFVPETGWGVMVPQPVSEIVDRARQVQFAGLMIGLIAVALATLASWWLSKLISQPVSTVARVAQRISSGELDARTNLEACWAPLEVKGLGRHFNEMVDELQLKSDQVTCALQQAEAGSQSKSQFMAAMSHEIRTPISGVVGLLEMLEETNLDDDQKKYLAVAQKTVNGLLQIINDILDFSKIQAGQVTLVSSVVDIASLADEVTLLFEPAASKKGLVINTFVDETVPSTVRCDAQHTRQILFNLIGNAVKFTEKGGVKSRISFSYSDENCGNLIIAISDTGIGIADDRIGELFKEFTQCDPSYSRRHGGTGLGLAISSKLAEYMGGKITVHSAQGVGSCFELTLPVTVEA